MDLSQREGRYPLPPQAGKILGVEFSGVIIQINENNADGFKEGDEVFGLAYGGRIFNADAGKEHSI
jgi:NADPH2:quinone reductase